ncbi:MAG: DoxX family protein [Bacteroidota bacterium]
MLKYYLSNTLRNTDLGLLILRIVGGGFMLTHGWPKLSKLLSGDMAFADPIGIGEAPSLVLTVFSEVVCSMMILIGWKGRLASIFSIITMAVAGLIVHGGDPWSKKEHALMYLGIYLVIFLMGTGKYGLEGRSSVS